MRYVALMSVLAFSPSTSRAQEPADAMYLRVRWEAEPPAHGLLTVCGRVLNDRSMSARRVRVRVEGVDERGAVTVRRDGDVLGQVSSRGTGLFCLTVSAGAATYRVTVVAADWAAEAESP